MVSWTKYFGVRNCKNILTCSAFETAESKPVMLNGQEDCPEDVLDAFLEVCLFQHTTVSMLTILKRGLSHKIVGTLVYGKQSELYIEHETGQEQSPCLQQCLHIEGHTL